MVTYINACGNISQSQYKHWKMHVKLMESEYGLNSVNSLLMSVSGFNNFL